MRKGEKVLGPGDQNLRDLGFVCLFQMGDTCVFFFLRWEMRQHFYSQRG